MIYLEYKGHLYLYGALELSKCFHLISLGVFLLKKMHFSLQFTFMVEVLNVLPVSSFSHLLYKRNTGKGTKCAQCP